MTDHRIKRDHHTRGSAVIGGALPTTALLHAAMTKAGMVVTPTPQIMAHPLWDGSHESMDYKYGSINHHTQYQRIQAKLRCDDLTPLERTWCALWMDVLRNHPM